MYFLTLALALVLLESSTAHDEVDLTCTIRDDANFPDSSTKSNHPDEINPLNPTPEPIDCYDILHLGQTTSGRYDIYPFQKGAQNLPVRVWCDMDTDSGGWTVFQRRADGTVDFYRDWEEYRQGFGFVGSEFWLGNENIHVITNQKNYDLRVDLEDWDGDKRCAVYDHFRLGSEQTKFKLSVGTYYSGNAGDSLSYHNNQPFSTADQDNDAWGNNCAEARGGPWWYRECEHSDLNGEYLEEEQDIQQGVTWNAFRGLKYSHKRAEMKIRPGVIKFD